MQNKAVRVPWLWSSLMALPRTNSDRAAERAERVFWLRAKSFPPAEASLKGKAVRAEHPSFRVERQQLFQDALNCEG